MRKNNTKGFTLIEVLIAMSIITIILIAFFGVLNNVIKMNKKTEKDIQMMDIAQSKIESIVADIREGTKNKSDIIININNNNVSLDSLFASSNNFYKNEEYTYKDGKSEYIVKFEIERKSLSENQILKNKCYLYNISYTVQEKELKFSNRKVTLSTSVLSLK